MKNTLYYLLMLPAIVIGMVAMISNDVPSGIWLQNISIWLLGTILCSVFLNRNKNNRKSDGKLVYSVVILALLVSPFLSNGLEGVHRWLTIGPINLYIASILLPVLIIQLWGLTFNDRKRHAVSIVFITLIILLLQPDAGQLTAFASVAVIMLWKTLRQWVARVITILLVSVISIISWTYLDDLAPVPYVEQIIFLVGEMGNVWFIIGVLSLFLLLGPFFINGKQNFTSLSLGVYFLVTMVVTFFGNFPMSIMGYGISPIIGYLLALTWLIKNKQ